MEISLKIFIRINKNKLLKGDVYGGIDFTPETAS